jgi:hypothetical protein
LHRRAAAEQAVAEVWAGVQVAQVRALVEQPVQERAQVKAERQVLAVQALAGA